MADDDDSRALSALEQNGNLGSLSDIINSDCGASSSPKDCVPNVGLAEELNCAYSPQNSEFVGLFTSGDANVSTFYHDLDTTLPSQCSQSTADSTVILQQGDIEKLDSELNNTPKDLYIQKLLQLTTHNEQLLMWYRNILSSRAKEIEGCPKGNLINRKSTKRGSSAEKIARDCFILYSFTHGSKSGIEEVYDKAKPPLETPKVAAVELRALTQSLLQRVSDLEKSQTEKDTTIQKLRSEITSLKSNLESVKSDLTELKASCTSK